MFNDIGVEVAYETKQSSKNKSDSFEKFVTYDIKCNDSSEKCYGQSRIAIGTRSGENLAYIYMKYGSSEPSVEKSSYN